MEALYSKLYDKYSKLKVKKECEIEKNVHDQDVKFMKYISVGDELIECFRKEIEKLHAQVEELRSLKDEQYANHQKIMMEENLKSKKLSEEIERLKKLQHEAINNNTSKEIVNTEQSKIQGTSLVESDGLSMQRAKKRSRHDRANQLKENANHSEDKCVFRNLSELLIGMKLSTVDEMCISATHQSSGYLFQLEWIDDPTDGDGETKLLYEVLSLGTLERVAPEWMREIIVFSTRMCPVFLHRLSRAINLHA